MPDENLIGIGTLVLFAQGQYRAAEVQNVQRSAGKRWHQASVLLFLFQGLDLIFLKLIWHNFKIFIFCFRKIFHEYSNDRKLSNSFSLLKRTKGHHNGKKGEKWAGLLSRSSHKGQRGRKMDHLQRLQLRVSRPHSRQLSPQSQCVRHYGLVKLVRWCRGRSWRLPFV